jgi:hypothetical protein
MQWTWMLVLRTTRWLVMGSLKCIYKKYIHAGYIKCIYILHNAYNAYIYNFLYTIIYTILYIQLYIIYTIFFFHNFPYIYVYIYTMYIYEVIHHILSICSVKAVRIMVPTVSLRWQASAAVLQLCQETSV